MRKVIKFIFGKVDLDDSNIKRLLIRLSIPAILGIFVNNLYNIIDSIFVGRGVGADAIGALTIAYPLQVLLNAFVMMVATGGMSILSRSLGEKDKEKASYCFGNSITIIVLIALISTIFGLIFLKPILTLFGGRGHILDLSMDYMRIILLGTIFIGPACIFAELLRAEGKSKQSMIVMSIGAVANVILDYFFIIVFKMGVKGAATATTLANFVSFAYGVYYLLKGDSVLRLKLRYFKIKFHIVKEMLSVGMSSLISQGAGSISVAVANIAIVSVGGDILINAIGVFNRIHSIIFMPIFGVVQGMQPILGYNYGAKRLDKVREAAKLTLKYGFLIALANTVVIFIFTKPVVTLFVDDKELINYAVPYIRLAILFCCVGAWQSTGGTIFRAVGNAKKASFFALLRQIIIFVPNMIILSNIFGALGCWISYAFADLLSGLISIKYINNFLKKLKCKEDNYEEEKMATI